MRVCSPKKGSNVSTTCLCTITHVFYKYYISNKVMRENSAGHSISYLVMVFTHTVHRRVIGYSMFLIITVSYNVYVYMYIVPYKGG